MTQTIVDALELPPGPDGKAHPDFWIYTDFNGKKSPRWRPAMPSDFHSHDGTILPNAARSIAWLWDEAKRKYGENEWQRCQRLAWYSCARGEPDYTRLPVVEFGWKTRVIQVGDHVRLTPEHIAWETANNTSEDNKSYRDYVAALDREGVTFTVNRMFTDSEYVYLESNKIPASYMTVKRESVVLVEEQKP